MESLSMRWLAVILAISVTVIVIWFQACLTEPPAYDVRSDFDSCVARPGDCPMACEDVCVWGLLQRLRWDRVCAYLFLYLMSLSCFVLMLERWFRYALARKQSKQFRLQIETAIHENRMENAIWIAEQYPASPVAVVVYASLSNQSRRAGDGIKNLRPSMTRQRAIVFETEELTRGLWALAAAGWTIPLVGIILFVTGIITALLGLRAAEGAGIGAIAGSLAESLWAPVFSALVAIPIIWSHKYFASTVRAFSLEMDWLSLAVINEVVSDQQLSHWNPRPSSATQELRYLPATKALTVDNYQVFRHHSAP